MMWSSPKVPAFVDQPFELRREAHGAPVETVTVAPTRKRVGRDNVSRLVHQGARL